MIPRFSPDYRIRDLTRALRPSRPDAVIRLEDAFVRRSGHSSALAFRYGRSGLYFLLKALGFRNKKVILPAYTCVVVAHAVVLSGNTPVFLDNRPGAFQPDPEDYLRSIDTETGMVVPTHLFGIAEETSELYRKIKAAHPHVFVLQDCAHSFFCTDSTGEVVTRYGDGAIFGMNISKLVNSVRGGMLTLRDPALATKVRELRESEDTLSPRGSAALGSRAYALAAAVAFTPPGYEVVNFLSKRTRLLESETQYFEEEKINLPKDFMRPMLPYEAEVGIASLERFDERVRLRREIAEAYIEVLQPLVRQGDWILPRQSPGSTWSHFPVAVEAPVRDQLRAALGSRLGAEIGIIVDYSIPDLAAYRARCAVQCPRATDAARRVLNLPLTWCEGLQSSRANWKCKVALVLQVMSKK